jgi:hypothetical protein
MNRTILIVICDFLLVSLLAFSTIDINQVAEEGSQRQVKLDLAPNPAGARQDLTSVMKLALDDERRGRERLQGELAQTKAALGQQQAALTERERQMQAFRDQVQAKEQQSLRLQQEKASLEQQYATAQTNMASLHQQLQASLTDHEISQQGLAALEAELRAQQAQAKALEQGLDQLSQSNQVMQAERQKLATQLQVVDAEKRAASELVNRMVDEVKVVREEKAQLAQHADRLAEGVKVLASNSGELAKEIRDHRPLSPNTVFGDFVTNRVTTRFQATRAGIFGSEANKRRNSEAILVTDGTNFCALTHVDDTPLTIGTPGTEWERLTGTLGRGTEQIPIKSLSFALADPRVVLLPLTEAEARQLGGRVYQLAADPFKFQDAVIVGAREGYYGECKFQMELSTPQYCKMDRNFLKGVFGKFNPSRGDLVFSKTGELLGIMANGTYCMMIQNFKPAGTLQFDVDLRDQHPGAMLSRLDSMIAYKPFRLQ